VKLYSLDDDLFQSNEMTVVFITTLDTLKTMLKR